MRLFSMKSGQLRVLLVQAGAALAAAAFVAGCGNSYRPVVTPVNPSGPAAQPTAYTVVVSAPSPNSAGIVTLVDYSGDTVLTIAPIGPGPTTFTLDELGASGYTLNSDGTLSNFPITTTLQAKNVTYTTLASTAAPVNLMAPSAGLWAADLTGNVIDLFTSTPEAFKLAIPVAPTPVTIAGSPTTGGQREYVISQNFTDPTGVACNTAPTAQTTGVATPIEISTNSADAPLPLGKCPVFAVNSADQKRLFVLNRGDDTVTVINAQNNTIDACTPFLNQNGQTVNCHPLLPLSTTAVAATHVTPPNGVAGMGTVAGPVYAEFNQATSQLVVANYDGGTITLIDVSLDEYGNDSSTFGTTYTIPVGNNPASVTVLADGTRAYTANQTDQTVTIANLTSHTVEKTLTVVGHPRTVVNTQNSQYGKVYAASPDSPYLTILATLTDLVDTTVLVEGNIVDVRVTTQNGSQGNSNYVSRSAGHGEPCNLPPALMLSTYGANYTLKQCQAIP
jgi:DNA-binding beta-propeller fold protein YncE